MTALLITYGITASLGGLIAWACFAVGADADAGEDEPRRLANRDGRARPVLSSFHSSELRRVR